MAIEPSPTKRGINAMTRCARRRRRQKLEALAARSSSCSATSAAGKCRGARSTVSSELTRDRPSIQRRGAEHPGAVRLGALGLARLVRARANPGTKQWYGTNGNSFVAVVEFGTRVRARAVTAGGESGHPNSPHFNDQAERYASGDLRESISIRSS